MIQITSVYEINGCCLVVADTIQEAVNLYNKYYSNEAPTIQDIRLIKSKNFNDTAIIDKGD